MAAAQRRMLEGGARQAVQLLTDGRGDSLRPSLAQRLQLQPGEGTNPLPTEVHCEHSCHPSCRLPTHHRSEQASVGTSLKPSSMQPEASQR